MKSIMVGMSLVFVVSFSFAAVSNKKSVALTPQKQVQLEKMKQELKNLKSIKKKTSGVNKNISFLKREIQYLEKQSSKTIK